VIDLGSGSGMDACYAAHLVGARGRVVGIDFRPQQVARARRIAAAAGIDQVEFREGRIEDIPAGNGCADCVISNGVINLSPDKPLVFSEAATAEGIDRLRCRPVGSLHRRSRATRRSSGGDQRRGASIRGAGRGSRA
jgi:SAM-dependent methyltransferase